MPLRSPRLMLAPRACAACRTKHIHVAALSTASGSASLHDGDRPLFHRVFAENRPQQSEVSVTNAVQTMQQGRSLQPFRALSKGFVATVHFPIQVRSPPSGRASAGDLICCACIMFGIEHCDETQMRPRPSFPFAAAMSEEDSDNPEFEVERILKSRKRKGVRWRAQAGRVLAHNLVANACVV